MSWKFGAALLRGDHTNDLSSLWSRLGLKRVATDEEVTLGDATSSRFEATAVGALGGATLILDQFLPYNCSFEDDDLWWFDEQLVEFSKHDDALVVLLDGVSGTYGFSFFSGGERVRRRSVVPGYGEIDEGEAIAGEGPSEDHEARIFSLISQLTGMTWTQALTDETLKLTVWERPDDD